MPPATVRLTFLALLGIFLCLWVGMSDVVEQLRQAVRARGAAGAGATEAAGPAHESMGQASSSSGLLKVPTESPPSYVVHRGGIRGEAARGKARVALYNHFHGHSEVYSALLWAWTDAGYEVDVFCHVGKTWGVELAISDWYNRTFMPLGEFGTRQCGYYGVVVLVTADFRPGWYKAAMRCPEAKYVGVVHSGSLIQQMPAGMDHLLVLSPHVRRYILNRTASVSPGSIDVLVPIYPVNIPRIAAADRSGITSQGIFYTARQVAKYSWGVGVRSFEPFLRRLKERGWDTRNHSIMLLGSLAGGLPPYLLGLPAQIGYRLSLPYRDFYFELSKSLALLPLLAPQHMTTKASSSIPAALICEVPLLGPASIAEAYDHVPLESMWLHDEGMSDVGSLGIVTREGFQRRLDSLLKAKRDIYHANCKLVGKIMEGVVADA